MRTSEKLDNIPTTAETDYLSEKESTSKQKNEKPLWKRIKWEEKCSFFFFYAITIEILLVMCCQTRAEGYLNHPPRFLIDDQTEIVLRLKEGNDTPAGSLIYKLRGFDPDGDSLTFGFREPVGAEILRIEKVADDEANLYLKKELDRETKDEYALVLTLTDGNLGEGNFITQSLLILVEDVNDNEPIFKQYQSTVTIAENSPPGVVLTVEATDRDEGTYGQVIYRIQDLDGDDETFAVSTVNGKGVIRLVKELDYEKKYLYQLKVLAVDRSNSDRVNTGTAAIVVKVEDVEDQFPEFLIVSPVSRINEDAQVGTQVMRVKAVDGDRGVNNPITYSITKGALGAFEIDPDQGIVYTAQKLDRESPNNNNGAYILEITAQEKSKIISPPPSIKTEVTIIVTDVNDEIPTFRSDFYEAEINENAQVNTPITFFRNCLPEVYDHDQGNNGTFQMFLEGDQGIFEVSPSKGFNEASFLIRVKNPTKLDYEKLTYLNFTILAKETVLNEPKYSFVPITVHVRDINDNIPRFSEDVYRVSVPENSAVGTTIVVVRATDDDSGDFGSSGIRYTALGGSMAEFLSLDEKNGTITISSVQPLFDREFIDRHYLTVEAADDLGKGNRNTVQIIIDVQDVNDNAPKFLQAKYEARLLENHLNFETPLIVEAHDKDLNGTDNTRIRYSIVEGTERDNFTIDPILGLIQPKHHMDFEVLARANGDGNKSASVRAITLVVKAQDQGVPSLSSNAVVNIYVSDMNDHAPVFEKSTYEVAIDESLPPGTSVLRLTAFDEDASSPNNDVVYRIQRGAKDKFVIDADTGVVTVAPGASLDPDQTFPPTTYYHLVVLAIDGGIGVDRLEGYADVNITIKDVNNKPPVFRDPGTIRIKENLKAGQYVYRLEAEDPDSNPVLRYHIDVNESEARNQYGTLIKQAEIDVAGLFDLDTEDGTLRVRREIDREKVETIRLSVVCQDLGSVTGVQKSFATLAILVEDENDNDPVFRQTSYRRSITENSKAGVGIVNVVADDFDKNRTIKYSLVGPKAITGLVHLDPDTGEIVVANKIDREITTWLNFSVKATDSGVPSRHSLVPVFVQVLDENDNNPLFLGDVTNLTVREDTPIDDKCRLCQSQSETVDHLISGCPILAKHEFLGRHNKVCQYLHWNICREYGLEGVSKEWYNHTPNPVTVAGQCTILNDQQIHTDRTVTANKPDVVIRNDAEKWCKPIDESVPAEKNITMKAAKKRLKYRNLEIEIGKEIAKIEATDSDSGEFGKITYLLDRMSSKGQFRIDAESGVLSVADTLDREKQSSYVLVVEAWDNYQFGYRSGESRNAFKQIGITIIDVNDEIPRFEPIESCISVTEFHDIKEVITVIKAFDDDDPLTPNGRLTFSIVGGNENNLFRIGNLDYTSAKITAAVPLKGFYGNFTLTVQAQDLGSPSNRAWTKVPICVADVNDNAPVFIRPERNLTIKVPENATVGTNLIQVVAVDEDIGANGAVRYRMRKEPAASWHTFAINEETGVITLKRPLDRERQKSYELRVEAHDMGIPTPLSSDLDLTVYVKNINDFQPQFLVDEVIMNFTEHEAPGLERRTLVGTVDNDDPDDDEDRFQACYFIVGGNENGLFSLDPLKHELMVEQELDREEVDEHVLLVKASEDCLHAPSNVTVFNKDDDTLLKVIVNVNDINDHPPKFTQRIFTGGVTTNADFGTEFMRVKAVDRDAGKNGEIKYYLIGEIRMTLTEGMDSVREEPFLIDEKSGALYLNFYPQKGMKGYFELTVKANDSEGLEDTAGVYIYLLREDQRVRFVLRQHPSELRDKVDKFRDELKDITGAVVNVDEIKVHENKDGSVDRTKTDLYMHFVNQEDNSVIDVHNVLYMIDQNIERLDALFKDFNVLDTQPAQGAESKGERESEHIVWLLGVIIFLAIMQVLVVALCFSQRSKYKRAIKAATATAFGSEQSSSGKATAHMPNTNKHSMEGSNPIWLKSYENEWYREDDSLSQNSARDSLDNNAITGPMNKSINMNNVLHSDNNNVNYNSSSHIMPEAEKEKVMKENDFNFSNCHKNLYHSLNSMANTLVLTRKMETTEL